MKRILVVDDDRALLAMIRRWLVEAGYDVIALSDFQAAKSFLSLNSVDVVVADIRIGANNGLQLLAMHKQAHPEAVAIAMTGFDDAALRKDAEHFGARFVLKPIAAAELVALIE